MQEEAYGVTWLIFVMVKHTVRDRSDDVEQGKTTGQKKNACVCACEGE